MPELDLYLKIERCPHCSIDKPNLNAITADLITLADGGDIRRIWKIYKCERCGGLVTAYKWEHLKEVGAIYPKPETIDENLPDKVKSFLQQAMDSVFAPSGSVMLSGSAVDAMLKEKGYIEGSLYTRIENAVTDHLITPAMAQWAHQVRLDANDQRHADKNATLPTEEDAHKSIEFAKALAEFLFVLPSKVAKGLEDTKPTTTPS